MLWWAFPGSSPRLPWRLALEFRPMGGGTAAARAGGTERPLGVRVSARQAFGRIGALGVVRSGVKCAAHVGSVGLNHQAKDWQARRAIETWGQESSMPCAR